MKTYEQTHPWLKFAVDLTRARPQLWLALGEAQSKCAHVAGTPLAPELAKELHAVYLAKGLMATTAIEGNTLSEEQVRQRVEGNLKLPSSLEYQGREIDNVLAAVNLVGKQVLETGESDIRVGDLYEFNRLVLEGLALEDGAVPGEIPTFNVTVGRYRGAPRQDCAYLLERLCAWLNSDTFAPTPGNEVVYAIVKSVLAHLYFAWIHPFGDGNGRTARLLEFKILLAAGVPSASAHLLSNHYNATRARYYRELDLASRSGGDVLPFLEYAVTGFVEALRTQIEQIRQQQWRDSWTNFVHDFFRDEPAKSARRQRDLLLDLSDQPAPVPRGKLLGISARVATSYAGLSDRTLARDLLELTENDLVELSPDGYVARRSLILAFLPKRVG